MIRERVRSLGGPGGLRCSCCGYQGRSPSGKHAQRKMVRIHRRKIKRAAIREQTDG